MKPRKGQEPSIEVLGVSMGVDISGPEPELLLVHGFPLDRSMWRSVTGRLGGCRTVAPDLRGFGATPPAAARRTMEAYADDLAALLDVCEADAVVVCGLSMGGYIAFEFWRRYPERVRGLILANTKAAPDDAAARAQRDQMIDRVRHRGCGEIAEQLLGRLVAPETLRSKPGVVRRLRKMIQACHPEGVTSALHAMRARADARPLLSSIAVPALVIAGAADQLVPVEEARAMAAAIPSARFTLVSEAGHLAPLEQPKRVADEIAAFLNACG